MGEGGVLLAFSPQVDYLIAITMQDHLQTPVTELCTFPVTVLCNKEFGVYGPMLSCRLPNRPLPRDTYSN
jgi:hypothetical protein